jgi:hypothetical protein
MSKYIRCTNREARRHVQNHREFRGNNLFAGWHNKPVYAEDSNERLYVVYSYDEHWPLFIYHQPTDTWFENMDRISVTTSKHRSQSHPHLDTKQVSKGFMIDITLLGLTQTVASHAGIKVAA